MLDRANLVGKKLCQGQNDYDTGGILYGLFLAPEIKHVLTINDFGIIEEHNFFKRYSSAMLPKSWKNCLIVEISYQRK